MPARRGGFAIFFARSNCQYTRSAGFASIGIHERPHTLRALIAAPTRRKKAVWGGNPTSLRLHSQSFESRAGRQPAPNTSRPFPSHFENFLGVPGKERKRLNPPAS